MRNQFLFLTSVMMSVATMLTTTIQLRQKYLVYCDVSILTVITIAICNLDTVNNGRYDSNISKFANFCEHYT